MEHLTNILINNTGTLTGVVVWLIVFFLVYRLLVAYLGNRSRLESLRIQQETERILRLKKLENDRTQAGLVTLKELADTVGQRVIYAANQSNKPGSVEILALMKEELTQLHKTIVVLGGVEKAAPENSGQSDNSIHDPAQNP